MSDTTINANFDIIQYTLIVENDGNGTTNPIDENLFDCDEDIVITATPNECYTFVN